MDSPFMSWSHRKSVVWGVIVAAAVAVLAIMANLDSFRPTAPKKKLTLEDIPFNGARAYKHLVNLCSIGPRIAGTKGMEEQQELVTRHFKELGAKVTPQSFEIRHPETFKPTRITNLIVEFHPDRMERVLLCAHYDTRPFPDEDPDPKKRRDPFLGANDGASGVALLMELGTHLKDFPGPLGVDIVLFDAEELVYDKSRGDQYFVGSNYFAHDYAKSPPKHKYRCGVLLDMVGDKELQLYHERNSVYLPDVKPVTLGIWATAEKLGVSEFISRRKHDVKDDHLPLNNTAQIPTCDIIDFDYPRPGLNYWHTTQDKPENCSALSLAKVGWVLHEWLKQLK